MKYNSREFLINKIYKLTSILLALLIACLLIGVVNTSNIASLTSTDSSSSEEESSDEYDVSEFNTLDYEELQEAIESEDYTVVYVGRSSCSYCLKFLPIMKEAQENYGFITAYVDLTEVTDEEYYYLLDFDEFFETYFGSTPMVVIFKDGEYINGTVGYTDYDTYAAFLETSGIIEE
ncbi:MAG TPA: thioredoxin family protein [Bacilli bacterium]|nr:thioredoxin family protein [Bacilli bacterium]